MRPTDSRLVMLSFNLPTGPDHLSLREEEEGLTDGVRESEAGFSTLHPHVTFSGSSVPPALTDKNTFPSLTLFMENPTDQDEKRSPALDIGAKIQHIMCFCLMSLSNITQAIILFVQN